MGEGEGKLPSLADTIAAVRRELSAAQAAGQGQSVQFRTGPVELEFEVAVTRTGGGQAGVQLWVLTLGRQGRAGAGDHAADQGDAAAGEPGTPARTRRSPTPAGAGPGRAAAVARAGARTVPGTACGWRGKGGGMGVDRYRVCELYAAGPDGEGSGSGYRLGDRLVLDRPACDRPGGWPGRAAGCWSARWAWPGGCPRGWSGRTPTRMRR